MDVITELKISFMRKIISLPYFLFLLSLALFLDTYLQLIYGQTIRSFSHNWSSIDISIGSLMTFVGSFGFFYAVLLPGMLFFYSLVLAIFSKESFGLQNGYVSSEQLKRYALKENNQVAYSEYLSVKKQISEQKHLDVLCLSLVLLSLAGYFLSPVELNGLTQFVYYGIEKFPWYIEWPLKLATTPFILFIIMVSFRTDRVLDEYEYLPDLAAKLLDSSKAKAHSEQGNMPLMGERGPASRCS